MNHDALRAASMRLSLAQAALARHETSSERTVTCKQHLLGLQAALAEMYEPRQRRATDRTIAAAPPRERHPA